MSDAGFRTQDESAEDPVVVLKNGLQPDLQLYWRNKLMRPLSEIFSTCLDQSQLQVTFSQVYVEYVYMGWFFFPLWLGNKLILNALPILAKLVMRSVVAITPV